MSKPYLKWAGGKRQMRHWLASKMPQNIDHYIEPFLGGGAMALHLLAEGCIKKATCEHYYGTLPQGLLPSPYAGQRLRAWTWQDNKGPRCAVEEIT